MQTFIDAATDQYWQFEDDVRVEVHTISVGDPDNPTTEERRQFFAPHGARLNVPDTLVPGELPAPVEPSFDDLQAAKLAEINVAAQGAVSPYIDVYPSFEVATWGIQKAEAKAFALDPTAATPFADIAAADRGIAREVFLAKVAEKADLFVRVSAKVAGYRQRLEDTVVAIDPEAEDAREQLAAVMWEDPLAPAPEPDPPVESEPVEGDPAPDPPQAA